MDAALVHLIRERARGRCEYCQIPEEYDDSPFEVDHIIAIKHNGPTLGVNLALSCFHDNSRKGSNIASFDPQTRKLTPLSTHDAKAGIGIFVGKGPS
jgi:5-methylcytosine-specific restriction endonuclease McrA